MAPGAWSFWSHCSFGQETESDEFSWSVHFLLLKAMIPADEMLPSKVKINLGTSISLI